MVKSHTFQLAHCQFINCIRLGSLSNKTKTIKKIHFICSSFSSDVSPSRRSSGTDFGKEPNKNNHFAKQSFATFPLCHSVWSVCSAPCCVDWWTQRILCDWLNRWIVFKWLKSPEATSTTWTLELNWLSMRKERVNSAFIIRNYRFRLIDLDN